MKALMIKGDPDKPVKYKTQAEVDAANAFAKDFSKRGNYTNPGDAYVAQKPGDPVVQFIDMSTGKPYDGRYQQMPQSMIKPLPDWVTQLGWDKQWNQPYYMDGNDIVYVDKSWYNHPRFIKPQSEQDNLIAQRSGMANGLVLK